MTSSRRPILTALFLVLSAAATRAQPLEHLLEDPDAARAFDYCAWRFDDPEAAQARPELADLLAADESSLSAARLRSAALVDAGTRTALGASNLRACRRAFDDGLSMHRKFVKTISKSYRKSSRGSADDPDIAAVQAALQERWTSDQIARRVFLASKTGETTGPALWSSRLAYDLAKEADADATAYLRELLKRIDWPDAHRYGSRTANRAWLLAQHADRHVEFQELVLERMAAHLESGGVAKADYAHLFDRVAVNRGREQRYGTQPDWECRGGRLELMPVEDRAGLDARRATMELGPVQDALDRMSAATCAN